MLYTLQKDDHRAALLKQSTATCQSNLWDLVLVGEVTAGVVHHFQLFYAVNQLNNRFTWGTTMRTMRRRPPPKTGMIFQLEAADILFPLADFFYRLTFYPGSFSFGVDQYLYRCMVR